MSIYALKLNSSVLLVDFWADKFVVLPQHDCNSPLIHYRTKLLNLMSSTPWPHFLQSKSEFENSPHIPFTDKKLK